MRRIAARIVLALLVLLVLLGILIGVLWATTSRPREAEAWVRLADMPAPRGEVAVAATGERIVVAGGITGIGSSAATVSVYDPDEDAWSEGPDLPEPRNHAAAAALDGVAYVVGGSGSSLGGSPETSVWALVDGAWEDVAPMPEGRTAHGAVAVDGRLYVVGGQGPSADVLVFDGEGWTRGAPLPVQRNHLGVVSVDGEVWAIGGRSGGTILDRVDVYDPVEDAWRPGPALPVPMSAMAAGVLSDGIHVIGGEDPSFVGGGVIDRHDRLADGTWEEDPLPIVAVHGSPGAVIDGALVVPGGSRRQGGLSVLGWTGIVQAFLPLAD